MHKDNRNRNTIKMRSCPLFGWLLCCLLFIVYCCPPPTPSATYLSIIYSNVDQVGCCVPPPSTAATTIHDICFFYIHIRASFSTDCCLFFIVTHPIDPRLLTDWLLCGSCVILLLLSFWLLIFQPEYPPRHIVRLWCSTASAMVIDNYGGVIDDTNATTSRGDIREGVGWIWGGWGPLFIWRLPAMVAGWVCWLLAES
jgi:hypothetical protein